MEIKLFSHKGPFFFFLLSRFIKMSQNIWSYYIVAIGAAKLEANERSIFASRFPPNLHFKRK